MPKKKIIDVAAFGEISLDDETLVVTIPVTPREDDGFSLSLESAGVARLGLVLNQATAVIQQAAANKGFDDTALGQVESKPLHGSKLRASPGITDRRMVIEILVENSTPMHFHVSRAEAKKLAKYLSRTEEIFQGLEKAAKDRLH